MTGSAEVKNLRMNAFILVVLFLLYDVDCKHSHKKRSLHHHQYKTTQGPYTKSICMNMDDTIQARHKTCFLRPDTGPCRADILQWYFDGKQKKCYRFYWGGCQGNGNRFETEKNCNEYCYLDVDNPKTKVPFFCALSFDYGSCFGQFNRWGWDSFAKTCKRRLYSGCGGNQNNFETQKECIKTCLISPNSTMQRFKQFTTCVPFNIAELN